MLEGWVLHGPITSTEDGRDIKYSAYMVKPDVIESLELMEKVMELHPQIEEHLLKSI